MLNDNAPSGYDCQCCKKRHEFPAYVFAHWNEILTNVCDACGATHEILRGKADMTKLPPELPDNAAMTGPAGVNVHEPVLPKQTN